jgi:hypothetical protein
MKQTIIVEVTGGIISGCDKRLLEEVIPNLPTKQRKQYDEYYIANCELERELSFKDLMRVAPHFSIILTDTGVIIEYY